MLASADLIRRELQRAGLFKLFPDQFHSQARANNRLAISMPQRVARCAHSLNRNLGQGFESGGIGECRQLADEVFL